MPDRALWGGGWSSGGRPWQRPAVDVGSPAPPALVAAQGHSLPPVSLQGVCTMTAAFLHFFFLSSFCWVLTEAWQSYLAVIGRMRTRLVRKRFLCLGWGEQGLCQTLSLGFGGRSNGTGSALALAPISGLRVSCVGAGRLRGCREPAAISLWPSPAPPGLPALVVAVSVGFTRTKGYGTSS